MIAIILLATVSIYYKVRHRSWANPASLMSGVWAVILLVYESDLVALNRVDLSIYLIITVGVISFAFGTSTMNVIKMKSADTSTEETAPNFKVLYTPILILAIISIAIYIPDTLDSIRILRSGGTFENLRGDNESVINNKIILLFMNYITTPFITFLYPIAAYGLLNIRKKEARKRKIAIFLCAILASLTQIFTSGGRVAIVYLLIHVIIIAMLLGKRIRIPRKVKTAILILCIAAAIMLYYITLSRGVSDIVESMILYVCGCIPLLEHYVNEISLSGAYSFGGAFLFGVLQFVSNMLGNIGLGSPEFVLELTKALNVETALPIGEGIKMNAFVSMFYYFYRDGGYLGILLESAIYGMLSHLVYKRIKTAKENPRAVIAYAIISNTIIFSMIRFQLIRYQYLLSFIFVFLMIKKIRPAEATNTNTTDLRIKKKL